MEQRPGAHELMIKKKRDIVRLLVSDGGRSQAVKTRKRQRNAERKHDPAHISSRYSTAAAKEKRNGEHACFLRDLVPFSRPIAGIKQPRQLKQKEKEQR